MCTCSYNCYLSAFSRKEDGVPAGELVSLSLGVPDVCSDIRQFVIVSVSSAQGTVTQTVPPLPSSFPSHSLGLRSCLSHPMLICRGMVGRVRGMDSLL